MSDNNHRDNNNNIDTNKTLEELLESERSHKNRFDYEDEYVYGDTDEIDDSYFEDYDLEDYDLEDDPYANPREERKVRGKYSHLLEDESDDEDSQEPRLTLQERVAKATNKVLDFLESKKFNTMQWVVALGILIIIGVVIVLLMQAGGNLESNVTHQEQEGAQHVAREVAPEEFTYQQEHEAEIHQQRDELEQYIEETQKAYEEQVEELGEVPEGHIELQEVDGTVRYVSEEEYNEWLNQDVRENTTALEGDADVRDYMNEMDIEIMPASEDTWHNNVFEPKGNVSDEELYQTRGQYIYFAQKAIPLLFANQILASDFDTDTYVLTVTLNKDASFPLPDDFEDRMHYTYQNSGYQAIAPDALTIEYDEMTVDEYLATLD